jgi:hypothetical protein
MHEEGSEQMLRDIFAKSLKRSRGNLLDTDPLYRYAKKVHTCMQCGCGSNRELCEQCLPETDISALIVGYAQEIEEKQSYLEQAMQVCRACMDLEETEEVHCANHLCEHNFPRQGTQVQIQNLQKLTESLRLLEV